MLDLDGRRLPRRVPVHLPHHVPRAAWALESGRVDRAAVREVADERVGVRVEGAGGVRGGRDPDAVVVARSALAVCGVCAVVSEGAGRGGREAALTVHDVVGRTDLADVGGPHGTASSPQVSAALRVE